MATTRLPSAARLAMPIVSSDFFGITRGMSVSRPETFWPNIARTDPSARSLMAMPSPKIGRPR